jgi:inosine-uridine nucleoside N-ribohydrolase
MRSLTLLVLFCASCVTAQVPSAPPVVHLILDTDIGNDIDDALALAVIHALENRAEVELLAVTISKDNPYCAPYVDLVNTFYRRPDIPIGVVHHGKTPERAPMVELPATRRDANGNFLYPHRLTSGADAPDAIQLLTRVLNAQPDDSVTITQIGFSTNLARLLQSPGGRDLVQRKVKTLCLMAGNFAKSDPEYNVYTDPESASKLFENWPTPMIFSGFEIGLAVRFPYRALDTRFRYVTHHPIVDAYKIYVPKPEEHPTWDATAVLEAIRPDDGYFEISAPGRVSLGPNNTTVFTPDPQGRCRYLTISNEQAIRVRQVLVDLVSEPPSRLKSK